MSAYISKHEMGKFCPDYKREHEWGEWKPSRVLRGVEFRICDGCGSCEMRALVEEAKQ